MKRISLMKSWSFTICLINILVWFGCESTIVDPCRENTDKRILRFKEYCYDASGHVRLAHPDGYEDTEWMLPIKTESEVYSLFHQLTGLQIHPSEKYEYSYHSEDYRYIVRIVRISYPINNIYASLYIWIEGCPEIETIHFVKTSQVINSWSQI